MRFAMDEPFEEEAMRLTFACTCGFQCHMPEEIASKLEDAGD